MPRHLSSLGFAFFSMILMVSVWLLLADPLNNNTSRHKSPPPAKKQETILTTNRQYHLLDLDSIHQYLPLGDTTESSPTDHILILTPLMDVACYLDNYFQKLGQIDYPAELISLGFLVSTNTEDSDMDPTLLSLQKHVAALRSHPGSRYRRITVIRQKSESLSFTHDQRHEYELQVARRRILARCRNTLLTSALTDESWVLWLDSDVIDYSPDLLLRLIKYNKDIIAPNCFRLQSSWLEAKNLPYDRNNWIETKESLANQRALGKEDILFEGTQCFFNNMDYSGGVD